MEGRRLCGSYDNIDSRDVFEEFPLLPVNLDFSLSKRSLHVEDIFTGTTSLSVREYESKISHLKRRLTSMQEENTCLVQENSQLIGELKEVQLELASSKTKVSILGSSIECKKTNVCQMTQEIEGLEAEIQAQGDALKDAEIIQANNKETITKNSQLVASLKNELRILGDELKVRTNQTNRAEKQRDEALTNSKRQILDISDKLKKVLDSESILKQALISCDKERESWVQNCCQLEQDNASMNRLHSQLRKNMETMQAESAVLQSQQLREKDEVENGFKEMKRKNKSLRKLTRTQEQQLQQCQLEVEQSKAELASLEAIHQTGVEDHKAQLATVKANFQSALEGGQAELASLEAILKLLHLREDGSLCARPCLPSPDHSANVPILMPGEGYRQLLPALQTVVREGTRQAALALVLDDKLRQTLEEMSVLHNDVLQQDHQLHTLHTAMQERAAHTYHLETEVERLNKCLATTDRQREEMAMVLSRALEKNSELNQSLMERNGDIQHLQDVLEAMRKESQRALAERQAAYTDKCTELEEQIQTVQQSTSRIAVVEEDLISAQREREEAQLTVEALQDSLTTLTLENHTIQHYEDLLKAKEKDFQQASEDFQRAHTEKCKELGDQIQRLEECIHQRDAQMEKHFSSAQREREEAQLTAKTLQESLADLTLERERKDREHQEALRLLQIQAEEYSDKVEILESSLSTCSGELNGCIAQIEAAKERYEAEVHARDREVELLQVEASASANHLRASSEHNLDLQSTIERQQSILLDNAKRLAELLDEKAGLLEQMNHLEKELERERDAYKELEKGKDAVSKELKTERALASKEVEREKEKASKEIEREKLLASKELENERVQASKELEKVRMQASKELEKAKELASKELAEEKRRFAKELMEEKVLAAKKSDLVIELAAQEFEKEKEFVSNELKEAMSFISRELERVKIIGSKEPEEEKVFSATLLETVNAEAVKEFEKERTQGALELEKQKAVSSTELERARLLPTKELEELMEQFTQEYEKERMHAAQELEKERVRAAEELEKEREQVAQELEKERVHVAQELEKERVHVAQELEKERMRAAEELEKEREQAAEELEKEKEQVAQELEKERVHVAQELEKERMHVAQELEKERMRAAEELEKEREQAAEELEKEREQAAEELEKEKAAAWNELERARASVTEELEKERKIAAEELKEVEQIAQESCQLAVWHEREALQLSNSVMQLTENMSKVRGELTEKEHELLKIRRDSDTKAAELIKMEKMLQDTKSLMDKKTEPAGETKGLQENMVEDLEQKVRVNRRERRNSLHHTQMLESQMKTVRGELEDTLDHLQELRNKLRRSQKKAEERQAAMEKLAAGMSDTQRELEQTGRQLQQKNKEVTLKDAALREKQEEILKLQRAIQQMNLKEIEIDGGKEDTLTLIGLQSALEASRRESQERNKQVEFLSERLNLRRSQLQGNESMEEVALSHALTEELQQRLEEMEGVCETLKLQLDQSVQFGLEKENEARRLMEKLSESERQAADDEGAPQITVSSPREEVDTLKKLHQKEDPYSQDLERTRVQLGQAQNNVTSLLAELQTREEVLSRTSAALSVKETEISDLKTKISGLQRSSESQNILLDSGPTSTLSHNEALTRTTHLSPT